MRRVEETGKTVEEAITKALSSLNIKRENAIVEILNEPTQGILSFIGNKNARVSVKVQREPVEYIEAYFNKLIELMNISGKIFVTEDENKLNISIEGKKSALLIGRRGKTLNELQYLANATLRRQFNGINKLVIVDVEDYRLKRENTLRKLAESVARKVIQAGLELELEPMTPQERRIIHLALQDSEKVITYSKGEEPFRKVVVSPR